VSELRIDVADLLTHPGARRPLHLEAAIPGLGGVAARVDEPVRLDLLLEWVHDGIVARGTVHARWDAECSTCLRELAAELTVEVGELFEPSPVDGETYPLDGHEIDLEQLVRDAVLLELPLAPTCESLGLPEPTAPADSTVGRQRVDSEPIDSEPVDPRWAALSELEL
jgi:uncharacterized protein